LISPARRLQILVPDHWTRSAAQGRTILETRSVRGWVLPALLLGASLLAAPAASAGKVPIAVIVHEQVPVDELSLPELRRIFMGKRQFWSSRLTITLLMPPQGSPEREVLLGNLYERRTEAQYQQFWINKLFDDGAPVAPKITGSHTMSVSLVRGIPGAIALVPVDKIPEGVKVLRIDGKLPGESGYPLVASR
jgi:hypothetical protein